MNGSLLLASPRRSARTAFCVGMMCIQHLMNCSAQTPTPSLPPGVQDVVKLVKAGLNEDVVMAQIKNAGVSYSLSADQIIYLHDQGVSQNEITGLLASGTPSAAPPPVAPSSSLPTSAPTAPINAAPGPIAGPNISPATSPEGPNPAPSVAQPSSSGSANLDSFRAQLTPYGSWVDVPGYGLCWRPAVESSDPFWRPYCNQGHWTYTDAGWAWQSDYPWGNVVFHYGRWYRDGVGWLWVPGSDWAPAWVCWRQSDGYCGWAPLPPAAVFRPGIGLWFGGRAAVDIDFGLGPEAFHGRFIVEGLGRERMAALTHHEIHVEHEVLHDSGSRGRPFVEHDVARDERRDRHDR